MRSIVNWKTGEILYSSGARSLRGSKLSGLNLEWAMLENRDLRGTDLRGTRLKSANLKRAKLAGADLEGADLRDCDLSGAELSNANLYSAKVTRAIFTGVKFYKSSLAFADFYRATFGYTSFAFCEDLHEALRLEKARHFGPSSMDQITLRNCASGLPTGFLEGIGYTPKEIAQIREMYADSSSHPVSCFLSHADADGDFAGKLYRDLRSDGVMCWHFRYDMKAGDLWQPQIDDAIRTHERLILVCSRYAIYRPNVVHEILRAIDDERANGQKKLFPIRLDDHVLSDTMMREAREKVRSGEWRENWVFYVREYQIPDFSNWQRRSVYRTEYEKLLNALRSATGGS